MALKSIRPSFLWAGGIALAAALWVASGAFSGGEAAKQADATPGAGADSPKGAALASVRVHAMRSELHAADLVLRARTQAEHKVQLKSEMSGRVVAVPAPKGSVVKAGDPICQLDVGARQAQLEQANAQLKQAKLVYDAAVTLEAKGHRSATDTAAALAAYESATANVKLMTTELGYTQMRAPFDGRVDNRTVEVGDYMVPGTPCAMVVAAEPFLVVGAVSESQIRAVEPGTEGDARLITGETVKGKVTFLAAAADDATRTFRLELTVPNPDFRLHDGVTADIRIKSAPVPAVHVSPAILTLDDAGKVGIKIVENGTVRFVPVTIVADGNDGIWVAGLPESAEVITVGQEYVKDGQAVNAVPEAAATAGTPPAGKS